MNFFSRIFLSFMLVIFTSNLHSQDSSQTCSLEKVMDSYCRSLDHANQGVVESAIIQVMIMKNVHPDLDYGRLKSSLHGLIRQGATRAIKLKSYLALSYLENPDWFHWIKENDFKEAYLFFQRLDRQLDSQIGARPSSLIAESSN